MEINTKIIMIKMKDQKNIFDQKTLWPTNIFDQTKFDQQKLISKIFLIKKTWSTKKLLIIKKIDQNFKQ